MKMKATLLVPVAALWLGSSAAFAEEEAARATFGLQFQGLTYSSIVEKGKVGDEKEEKVSTTGIQTFPLADSYAWITHGNYNVYFSPFQDDSRNIGLSYLLNDKIELGSYFQYTSLSIKESKDKASGLAVAPFVIYYQHVGPFDSENIFSLGVGQTSGESVANDVKTKTSSSSTKFSYELYLVRELAKNFYITHGLFAESASGEKKSGDIKTKTSDTTLILRLVGFRVSL